jgi:ribosomal protein S18 acetylase RimI-like enzyme
MTTFRVRFPVDDAELSSLHEHAFPTGEQTLGGEQGQAGERGHRPWAARLEGHALTWIGAFDGDRLVGFVQVAWDGGEHAFLLDTMVDPACRRAGIGSSLVAAATAEARTAGCRWLHVDFEDHLAGLYLGRGGFRPTAAGIIAL